MNSELLKRKMARTPDKLEEYIKLVKKLGMYSEIVENNMDRTVLRIKDGKEENVAQIPGVPKYAKYFVITKGAGHNYVIQGEDRKNGVSWQKTPNSYTLISDELQVFTDILEDCVRDYYCTYIGENCGLRQKYCTNKRPRKAKRTFKAMWFKPDEICVHMYGEYWSHFSSLELLYYYLEKMGFNILRTEDGRSERTHCYIKVIEAGRGYGKEV